MKSLLQDLVNETVRDELESLSEAKSELPRPGKDRPWQEGDPTTIKELEKIFNWFHLSSKQLGKGDYYKFTPRIPSEPWAPMEDDFTKRISLAQNIKKAVEAVGGSWRRHVYAGDIKGYGEDDVDVVELVDTFKDCPKSPGNKYGTNFSVAKWLRNLDNKGQLTPGERRNKWVKMVIDQTDRWLEPTPKMLPKRLRDEFEACVPDANKTKEVWTVEPETFIRVATYNTNHLRFVSWNETAISLGIPLNSIAQNPHLIGIVDKEQRKLNKQMQQTRSKDNLYLTAAGAKVFNAFHSDADTIPYHR